MFTNESPFRDAAQFCVRLRAGPNTWANPHPTEEVQIWGASSSLLDLTSHHEGGPLAGRLAGNAESVCCASINLAVLPRSRSIANTKAHWWQTALDKHIAFFLSSIAIISKVTVSHLTAAGMRRANTKSSLCLFMWREQKDLMHFTLALKALGTLLGSCTQGDWKHTYLTSGESAVTCHWLTAKDPKDT